MSKLERDGEPIQVGIIAKNLEGMYRQIYRLYGTFLTEEKGKDAGTISLEEIALSSIVKEELYTPTSNS